MDRVAYESILIPIDGSDKSFDAFKYGIKFAENFTNCRITIVYVVNEENIKHLQSYKSGGYKTLSDQYSQQGRNYFIKAKSEAKKLGYDTPLIHNKILYGDPAEKLIEIAQDYDLIIMSVRGKKHVVEYMMGHVAERVINLAGVPVLVYP
ncbi:MAG: hypothetical protein GF317_01645 [Candidatus Lokiarchaeota archaeon]|nr:hypothetical protein [Candidatus Lokiarchaeota archaeon]MBD3198648.1 hypothetical protein [Candidatus Lokiarchaeota archaeon]